MQKSRFYIQCPRGQVHVLQVGDGPIPLVGIHGFGATSHSLLPFQEGLEGVCTSYLIDLPFHGATHWEDTLFEPEDLLFCIRQILHRTKGGPAIFLGESMGARIWMHLFPLLENQCRELWLVSPEGFQGKWAHLIGRIPPQWEAKLARLANRPEPVMRWGRRMRKLGLLDKSSYLFLQKHLPQTHRRERLLATWRSLRHFPAHWTASTRIFSKTNAPVRVLLGKQDAVIPPAKAKAFFRRYPCARILEVESGHHIRGAQLQHALEIWKKQLLEK